MSKKINATADNPFLKYAYEVPEAKLMIAEELCNKIFFMCNTLKELEREIDETGCVIKTLDCKGHEITKENPSLKQYNVLIKNYSTLLRQLNSMLPESKEEEFDELMQFINS